MKALLRISSQIKFSCSLQVFHNGLSSSSFFFMRLHFKKQKGGETSGTCLLRDCHERRLSDSLLHVHLSQRVVAGRKQ